MKRRKPSWRIYFSLLRFAVLLVAASTVHAKLVCSPLSQTCCSTPYSFVSYDLDPPAFPPACAQQKLSSLFSLEPLDFLRQHALILPSVSKLNPLFTENASLAVAQLSFASLTDSRPSLLLRHRLQWQKRSGTAYTVSLKKNPAVSNTSPVPTRSTSSLFTTPFYFSTKSQLRNKGRGATSKSGSRTSRSGSRRQAPLNNVTVSNASIPAWTVGVQSLDWAAIRAQPAGSPIVISMYATIPITYFALTPAGNYHPPFLFFPDAPNATLVWNYASNPSSRQVIALRVALLQPPPAIMVGFDGSDAETMLEQRGVMGMDGACVEVAGPREWSAVKGSKGVVTRGVQFIGVWDKVFGRMKLYGQEWRRDTDSGGVTRNVSSATLLNAAPMSSQCGTVLPPNETESRSLFMHVLEGPFMTALHLLQQAQANASSSSSSSTARAASTLRPSSPSFSTPPALFLPLLMPRWRQLPHSPAISMLITGSTATGASASSTSSSSASLPAAVSAASVLVRPSGVVTGILSSAAALQGTFTYNGDSTWQLDSEALTQPLTADLNNLAAFDLLTRLTDSMHPYLNIQNLFVPDSITPSSSSSSSTSSLYTSASFAYDNATSHLAVSFSCPAPESCLPLLQALNYKAAQVAPGIDITLEVAFGSSATVRTASASSLNLKVRDSQALYDPNNGLRFFSTSLSSGSVSLEALSTLFSFQWTTFPPILLSSPSLSLIPAPGLQLTDTVLLAPSLALTATLSIPVLGFSSTNDSLFILLSNTQFQLQMMGTFTPFPTIPSLTLSTLSLTGNTVAGFTDPAVTASWAKTQQMQGAVVISSSFPLLSLTLSAATTIAVARILPVIAPDSPLSSFLANTPFNSVHLSFLSAPDVSLPPTILFTGVPDLRPVPGVPRLLSLSLNTLSVDPQCFTLVISPTLGLTVSCPNNYTITLPFPFNDSPVTSYSLTVVGSMPSLSASFSSSLSFTGVTNAVPFSLSCTMPLASPASSLIFSCLVESLSPSPAIPSVSLYPFISMSSLSGSLSITLDPLQVTAMNIQAHDTMFGLPASHSFLVDPGVSPSPTALLSHFSVLPIATLFSSLSFAVDLSLFHFSLFNASLSYSGQQQALPTLGFPPGVAVWGSGFLYDVLPASASFVLNPVTYATSFTVRVTADALTALKVQVLKRVFSRILFAVQFLNQFNINIGLAFSSAQSAVTTTANAFAPVNTAVTSALNTYDSDISAASETVAASLQTYLALRSSLSAALTSALADLSTASLAYAAALAAASSQYSLDVNAVNSATATYNAALATALARQSSCQSALNDLNARIAAAQAYWWKQQEVASLQAQLPAVQAALAAATATVNSLPTGPLHTALQAANEAANDSLTNLQAVPTGELGLNLARTQAAASFAASDLDALNTTDEYTQYSADLSALDAKLAAKQAFIASATYSNFLHLQSQATVAVKNFARVGTLLQNSIGTLNTVTANANSVVSYTRDHFSLDSLNVTFALSPSSSSVTGSLALTAVGVTVVRQGVNLGPLDGLLQTFEDMFVDALSGSYYTLYQAVR